MTTPLDPGKAEAFAIRMTGMLNEAFLSVLVSIGHQTRLFEAMAELPPRTSAEIAQVAGAAERYVREWLGAMVVGGIVDYDAAAGTYRLPPEHAALLTRSAGMNNMAFVSQYVALVGSVEKQVIDCFRRGGGVPYSAYPDFQRLQGEESAALYDTQLVGTILPFVTGIGERLSRGIDVADVGCGEGHAINVMARAYPQSRFVGLDLSEEGVGASRAEAARMGLPNARFEVCDIAQGLPARYDLVTAFDTVHDMAWPRRALAGIAKGLLPGGAFLMMDIAASSRLEENVGHPLGPLLYSASVLHCMTVSLAQGGEGLGTMWGEQRALELLAEAGFGNVDVRRILGDPVHVFYVARRAT